MTSRHMDQGDVDEIRSRISDRHETLQFDDPGGLDQIATIVRHQGWKAFEAPLPQVIAATAKRWPGVFLDVGCNTGFYAMLVAASHLRNRVLAFEPVQAICGIARRNATLNGLDDRIAVMSQAISDRNGTAPLFIPVDDHGMVETSASLDADFKGTHLREDVVPVRRLDRAFAASPWRWGAVSIIKIDVEGHEAAVLAGAAWILRLHRPVVFVEMLDRADFGRVNELVRRRHYIPFSLRNGQSPARTTELRFDSASWNHALVPSEKAEDFEALPA